MNINQNLNSLPQIANLSSMSDLYFETSIKWFKGAPWLKIFHHKESKGVFADQNEVMFSTKPGLFSLMSIVDRNFIINDKYEMMIECPNNNFVMWRQSHFPNPNDHPETDKIEVDGLEINPASTATTTPRGNRFGGLSRSNMNFSIFDGDRTPGKWYFAIGIVKYDGYGGIPCNVLGNEIILWIRIPNQEYQKAQKINRIRLAVLLALL